MEILRSTIVDMPGQCGPATEVFAENALGVAGMQEEAFQLPPAILEAAPTDEFQRQAYMVGALAATQRRGHPVVQPAPFSEIRRLPLGEGFDVSSGRLPQAASPLVELIREEMPDLVLAADRGGRMLGLAVYKVWRQRYPGVPFPTIDGKLHFGRISGSVMPDDALGVIGHALNRSGVMAEMAMRKAEGDERPAKVLLLDDWTVYGNTAKRGKRSLEEMLGDKDKLTFMLGTMTGNERTDMRHVVGYSGKMSVPWADDSDLIGVIYSYYNPKDFRRNQSLVWPEPVRTKYARRLRQDLTWYVKRQIVPSPYEGSSTQLTPWKRVGFALRRGFKRIVNTSL